MKKLFSLMMLGAVAALASCQSGNFDQAGKAGEGKEVNVSLALNIQTASPTRSTSTPVVVPPGATLRYILEVYDATGSTLVMPQIVQTSNVFDLKLMLGQQYKFVGWADFSAGYYNTANLKAVSLVNPTTFAGNDPKRDAFFGSKQSLTVTASYADEVILKRPFGQIRIGATDWTEMVQMATTLGANQPVSVSIDYNGSSFYTTLDATTGIATGLTAGAQKFVTAAIPAVAPPYPSASDAVLPLSNVDKWVAFDYLLANAVAGDVVNFTIKFYDASNNVIASKTVTNIPHQQNYRTNLYGDLFTVSAKIYLIIDPDFEGSAGEFPIPSGQISELNALLAATPAPVEAISFLANVVDENTLTIPAGITKANVPTITVYLPNGFGANTPFTVNGPTYDGEVIFKVWNSATADLIVNLPMGDFTLAGGAVNSIDATVAANSLVIADGASVNTLNLKAGNAYIYGTANSVTAATGCKVFWGAKDAAKLYAITAGTAPYDGPNDGVLLMSSMTGLTQQVMISKDNYLFDGNGYALSGAVTTPGNDSKNLLAVAKPLGVTLNGATIRNITLSNSVGNGMVIQFATDVTLSKVKLVNNAQAGAIINGSTVTATGLYTENNGWGGVNVDKPGAAFNFSDATNTFKEGTKVAVWTDNDDFANTVYAITPPAGWTDLFNPATLQRKYYDGPAPSFGGELNGNSFGPISPLFVTSGAAPIDVNSDGSLSFTTESGAGPYVSIANLVNQGLISWGAAGITVMADIYIDPANFTTNNFGVTLSLNDATGNYIDEKNFNFNQMGADVEVADHPDFPTRYIFTTITPAQAGWYTISWTYYQGAGSMLYCDMSLLKDGAKISSNSYNMGLPFSGISSPRSLWFYGGVNGTQSVPVKSLLIYAN